jgi:hypothetical protein
MCQPTSGSLGEMTHDFPRVHDHTGERGCLSGSAPNGFRQNRRSRDGTHTPARRALHLPLVYDSRCWHWRPVTPVCRLLTGSRAL